MRLGILLASMAFSLVASTAIAAECDHNDQTQAGMNNCAGADYAASDAKLNTAYGTIMKRLSDDADARKLLQGSQQAWIAFRDAECKFSVSSVDGGSVYPMILAMCLKGLTDARVQQLDAYLRCEEGDLSCPVPAQ